MPIDVQVIGQNPKNYGVAVDLAHQIAEVPGAVDVHVHQEIGYPEVWVDVDRSKAGQLGLTQRDVANSLLISLSGSGDISPTEWLNFQNGVNYDIAVQTPQYRISGVDDLTRTPIAAPTANAGVRRPVRRRRPMGYRTVRLHPFSFCKISPPSAAAQA